MKQTVSLCIVLSRTNYGEADRIVTVLTPGHGKVRMLAKGVRRVKSKLAGGIEPFSVSTIGFLQGRGELATLTSSRLEQHFGDIVKDVDRTMYAYSALKVINKITEDAADVTYFALTRQTLAALNDLRLLLQLVDVWFQAQLLKLGGHTPNLSSDANGQKLSETASYIFVSDNMSFCPKNDGPFRARHIKLLRLAFTVKNPDTLKNIRGAEEVLTEILPLLNKMRNQSV